MCGICGTAGFSDRALLERMNEAIRHRGPDDGGEWISPSGEFGLGSRRLSIIDLSSAGHMPMTNEDGTVWLSYNGEIYNFRELRRELEARGHRFRSHTDSEVVVHAYEEWGLDCLRRFNGMFAFGLVDLRDGVEPMLLLARDRFGIKPLYYSERAGRLVFASEVKSLFVDPEVPREVDLPSLHRYLAFLSSPGPDTAFRGIQKLLPGHALLWRGGRAQIQPFWDMRFEPDERASERELVAEFRETLTRAVERHLISDVPLGIFLSGGLDSSTILALASRITGEPVTAYTIGFRPEDGRLEQSSDDAVFARRVADYFRADMHEIVVEPQIVDLLPRVVEHLDEPLADPAAINTLLIAEAARAHHKVLLSGQGADEVLAGYRVHRNHVLAQWVRRLPRRARNGGARAALARLPALQNRIPGVQPGLVLAAQRYLTKLLDGAALAPEEQYIFDRSYYAEPDQWRLYSPELRDALNGASPGDRHREYFAAAQDSDFLNRLIYVDSRTYLPDHNLTYGDKLSSAASVEVRVPFLDHEVVDLLGRVPPRLKLRGLTSKHILRQAMRGIVPDEVIRRRKAGFGAPVRAWLRSELAPVVDDLLSEGALRERGYFDPAVVRRMIEDDRTGAADHSLRIWALLTLEQWHRTYIDQPVAA